tara:strand:- start:308 stop:604 length:297 start_codon:yes stop_codon:yes gene_type:complete
MDLSNIDIDSYDWENNHDVAIINGVLMDRRLMGANIKGVPCYRFAKNAMKYGCSVCEICNTRYTNDMYRHRALHERSKKHKDALAGKITIEKRKKRVY